MTRSSLVIASAPYPAWSATQARPSRPSTNAVVGAGFGTGIDRADARDMEVMRPMLWPRIENPLRAPDQQAMGRALGCDAA